VVRIRSADSAKLAFLICSTVRRLVRHDSETFAVLPVQISIRIAHPDNGLRKSPERLHGERRLRTGQLFHERLMGKRPLVIDMLDDLTTPTSGFRQRSPAISFWFDPSQSQR